MSHLAWYAIVAAVVFGLNLLPAFGPPTWAVLVFYRLTVHLNVIPLVVVGAVAAASGRLVLALAFSHLRGRVSGRTQENLNAAGKVLSRDRKRSVAGVALFALSPLPSAQLFEAAGLIGVSLRPLTVAFFLGRLVSYGIYVGGASAAASTSVGHLVTSSFTSPWGIALQVIVLAGLVVLTRVDWIGKHKRHQERRHAVAAASLHSAEDAPP
jgi:uncharacterized membrane protein YdjX (TVP38/TMEM64 family)